MVWLALDSWRWTNTIGIMSEQICGLKFDHCKQRHRSIAHRLHSYDAQRRVYGRELSNSSENIYTKTVYSIPVTSRPDECPRCPHHMNCMQSSERSKMLPKLVSTRLYHQMVSHSVLIPVPDLAKREESRHINTLPACN